MIHPKLVDRYKRNLNYLRVSITDRCNLRCSYCVSREDVSWLGHDEILRYEEILRVVRLAAELGITKVRVTGGEPLVRKGVYDFIAALTRIETLADVSLTTNGVLLEDHIDQIRAAGITRINISLDTLRRERFEKITGRDCFEKVWRGIMRAHETGFSPIKLNIVALKGINEDELMDFARLTFSYPLHVRFIEHMPIGRPGLGKDSRLLADEIKESIQQLGLLEPIGKEINDGPAERFKFRDTPGEIGFIRPLSRHFCNTCNRLRLTADGHLRSCLLSDKQIHLKEPLRRGCTDEQLAEIFIQAVKNKPSAHQLNGSDYPQVKGKMSAIGG